MAKIIIVGGGVAGLSAGIYAQLCGHTAIICEKHSNAGGNLTGWQREGYQIDNCIHWLTGTNPTTKGYRMWCELGALGDGVNIHYSDTLYTCSRDGQSVSLYLDIEATRASMYAASPTDAEEIDEFISAVKAMMVIMGLGDKKVKNSLSSPRLLKYYFLSTGELALGFKHPLLRDFICGVLGDSFGAIALVTVFAIFCGKNGGIPQGGSVAMANRMVNRFLGLGGQLYTKSEIVRIELEGKKAKRAVLSDGRTINGDYVILTTDPVHAFNKLLGIKMPAALRRKYDDPETVRFSSVHCAFACDTDKPPFSADHIFAMPNRYRELIGSKYLVLREFTHEKDFAPTGKCVIQAMVFCNEKTAREFIALSKDHPAYEEKKRELSKAFLYLIEEKFPSLSGKLRVIDVWTPATYKRYTNSDMGSYMSFILPPRSFPIQIRSRVKGVSNLFLATQWQRSPGGLPIAAECGRAAIKEICAAEKRSRKAVEHKRLKPIEQ